MQVETLDKHYRRAMVLFSAYNVEKCVIVSRTIAWGEFKKYNLINPLLVENNLTFILDLTSIKFYMKIRKWKMEAVKF